MAARDSRRRLVPRRRPPDPYRTTAAEPTFFNLGDDRPLVRATRPNFPHGPGSALCQPLRDWCVRRRGRRAGREDLGVCCGASPMLVRQVAEAVGLTTEASRFSERMQNHFMYGDNERLPDHIVALGAGLTPFPEHRPGSDLGTSSVRHRHHIGVVGPRQRERPRPPMVPPCAAVQPAYRYSPPSSTQNSLPSGPPSRPMHQEWLRGGHPRCERLALRFGQLPDPEVRHVAGDRGVPDSWRASAPGLRRRQVEGRLSHRD